VVVLAPALDIVPGAVREMAASRAGNCAMIKARSAAVSETQRAISSSERPQPMQSRAAGWTTQTRLQGVSMLVSMLGMSGPGGES